MTKDLTRKSLLPQPSNQTPLLTLVWLKEHRSEWDAGKVVENMLRHACGPYGLTAITGGDAQFAWAMLLPDKFTSLTCWSIYVNGAELCLVEGEMYDDLPGLQLLPGDNPGLARHVAAHMRERPDRRLTDLNGIYSGVYVDPDCSHAYAFGDPSGTRPVFWLSNEKRFVVTGNIWAFRGCDGFPRHWDKMALMEMLTIGFPMAGRTWLAEVRQLQRGRQVRSHVDNRTEVRMLLEPIIRRSWSIQQSVHALRESMDETIKRICRRLDRPVGLALSGGLDSRILLASLFTQGLDHVSFTFCSNPEEADNRIAKSATNILATQHRTVVLDSAVAGALYRDCRLVNDGESPAFGSLLLAAHAQQETNTLMIGYPADLYAGVPIGPFQPLSLKSKRDLADCVLRAFMSQFSADQAEKLLAPAYRVSWQDVLDEWLDSFERIEQQSIMDVCLDHITDYRCQRRTRPRIDSTRFFCLPIYPYLDKQLYTAYRSLPLAHLNAARAHLALLCDYKTGLEDLRSAARSFAALPIYKEYRYRHFVHFGRIARQRFVLPFLQKLQETKGSWGFGRSALSPLRAAELLGLEHSQLFDWREVQNIIERARRGAFVNQYAMDRLVNAGAIDDFLFGQGFSGDRSLRFLEPQSEIHCIRSSASYERQEKTGDPSCPN